MVWRQLWLSKPLNRFIYAHSLKSICGIHLSPIGCVPDRFHHLECISTPIQESPRRISTSKQVLQSIFANGRPTDLVSLSIFLRCARQRDHFHDRYSFSLMCDVLTRLVQKFGSIDGVVRELERIGCVTKPQTFLHLIRICWLGGMYDLTFDAVGAMGRHGFTTNNFARNVVMDISFRNGQTDAALSILSENSAPNFLSYNIALCNLCKLRDLANIRVVVRSMLWAGYYPNAETFVMILNCLCKQGRLVQAFEILGLMFSLGINASVAVWNIIIDGFCRLGRLDMANHKLEKMINVGCSPNIMTYTSLIKGFMECEKVGDAFKILSMMESRECKIDVVLSNVMISCLSKLQLYDEALVFFYDLRMRKLVPDAYTLSSLVSSLCSSGKYDLFEELFSCFECHADLVALNSILSYLCKAGHTVSAVKFFHDMEDRGLVNKYSYASLLTGLCRSDQIDEAVKLYQVMVIKGLELDAHIHTLIISELIRAKKYERAFSLFREAERKQYPLDSVSYIVVVRGLVRRLHVQKAYSMYNKMKRLGFNPDASTTNILLSGFCKERDHKMVMQLLEEMSDALVEVSYETCIKVLEFISRSGYDASVARLLERMVDLGLFPQRAIDELLHDGHLHGVRVYDMHDKLLKESSCDDLHSDTCNTKGLIEFAA